MLHDETLHYLDNAATTRVDPAVTDAIRAAMTDLWANPSALYTPGLQAQQALGKARAQVAKTLGCTPGEVYFTACGSESNNLALRGAAIARRGWGRKILCSGYEHPAPLCRWNSWARRALRWTLCRPGRTAASTWPPWPTGWTREPAW